MQIVIIEDEKLTANDLVETIQRAAPRAEIETILNSVSSAIEWFQQHAHPDLIFSDIQLGDGLSFEIFKAVSIDAPVIFCTAFDEYALRAFEANGIDYLLKPFDQKSIETAIQKYEKLKSKFNGSASTIEQLIHWMDQQKRPKQGSVLVYRQDKILPVRFDDIALFYIENEITHLLTFDQKRYTINKTIEAIEEIASTQFFRVNRQFLVQHRAIKEASQYFARKLSLTLCIPFPETITVSKNKVTDFLNWLSSQ